MIIVYIFTNSLYEVKISSIPSPAANLPQGNEKAPIKLENIFAILKTKMNTDKKQSHVYLTYFNQKKKKKKMLLIFFMF